MLPFKVGSRATSCSSFQVLTVIRLGGSSPPGPEIAHRRASGGK